MVFRNKKQRRMLKRDKRAQCEISKNSSDDEKPQNNENRRRSRKVFGQESDNEDFEVAADHNHLKKHIVKSAQLDNDYDQDENTKELVQKQNRKNKKSGGFQSMGLSNAIFRGIMKKGYKVPTPIQRKTIPLIIDGRDIVAMARTGSGKTAAFLVPMFERLKTHSPSGARALVLSPTRELALQTFKFIKELGKFTSIKAAVILGGDRIEDQFSTLHENPDVIVATPGRFMHVVVEMNFKLHSVEYVVFDEADRLFELGFQEQLSEILRRLPESRQTLLFSATLPKLLVEFAKAGLNNPTLVRLDVDTKLSENLKMEFLLCRSEDKTAVLMSLLKIILKPTQQAILFVATRHHVEYLNLILSEAGYSCSYSYSALDPVARKQHITRFREKQTKLLLVTDLAARGIDIPALDHVINYNFPAKAKLFLHRVGRVARAGREGSAISLVAPDELSYLLDLHLFLGRSLKLVNSDHTSSDSDGLLGRVPQHVIDGEEEILKTWHEKIEIANMKRVISNAYKQYVKSRPNPSSESIKRIKALDLNALGYHPLFATNSNDSEVQRMKLLAGLKLYKPGMTILEVNTTKKTSSASVMRATRNYNEHAIKSHRESVLSASINTILTDDASRKREREDLDEIGAANGGKKMKISADKDEEYYVPYRPKDFNTERGLSLASSFDQQASSVQLDLMADDEHSKTKLKSNLVWDRKKKKFVHQSGLNAKQKKVKTESGAWVNASYKSNLYEEWKKRSKVEDKEDEDSEDDTGGQTGWKNNKQYMGKRKHRKNIHESDTRSKQKKPELHSKEQILKGRRQKWKKMAVDKVKQNRKQQKTKKFKGRT